MRRAEGTSRHSAGAMRRAAGTGRSCPRVLQLTLARTQEVDLRWLDSLPNADTLCAHVCLKGLACNSSLVRHSLRNLKRVGLHSCVEEPGGHANGHEGVCAFRFLLDHYDDSEWKGVFFLHGVRANNALARRVGTDPSYAHPACHRTWHKAVPNTCSSSPHSGSTSHALSGRAGQRTVSRCEKSTVAAGLVASGKVRSVPRTFGIVR
jgi:hypothetical protein